MTTMTYEQILTEMRGRVGIITLNRPDQLNAMTATMHRELRGQMQAWNVDDAVGAIVITGAGRGFCSGADIGGFGQAVSGHKLSSVEARRPQGEGGAPLKSSKALLFGTNGGAGGEGSHPTLPFDVW